MAAPKGFTKSPKYIRWKMWFQRHLWKIQQSGRFVVFIVYFTLFLDNVLLTVIVPIVPDMLQKLGCQESIDQQTDTSSNGECPEGIYKNLTVAGPPPNASGGNGLSTWLAGYARNISHGITAEANAEVGLLFASKAMTQLVVNPFVGTLTNRIGYTTPLFMGSLVLLTSSILYTFGETYTVLFLARSTQGIGSACVTISGMAMVADRYQDEKQRSKIMGITLGGTALGVLVGYPFGGVMYDFVGKTAPLAIVAALIFLDTVLQLIFLRPRFESERLLIGTSISKLISDPYIVLASGAICVSTLSIAALEPCLPIWLMDQISPPKWQLGTVFIPDSLGYLLGTNMFGAVAFKFGRWLTAILSLCLVGTCSLLIPLSSKMSHLLIPHFGLGLGIGVTDAALMPMLAYLVDTRHVALYGNVYAVAQVAVSLAYSIGPFLGGQLVKVVGFEWLMRIIGIMNILYCPFCFLLKDTKCVDEAMAINMKTQTSEDSNVRNEGRTTYSSFVDEDQ